MVPALSVKLQTAVSLSGIFQVVFVLGLFVLRDIWWDVFVLGLFVLSLGLRNVLCVEPGAEECA